MTTQLYFAPGACSFVPHVLLEAAGAAFEPTLVKLHKGEQRGDAYLAINPRGQVPVLVEGDAVITQILAIVTYLHERFPQMQYLPGDPLAKARVLQTLAWMNNTVHPTFTHIFMPQKFTDNAALQGDLKRFNTTLFAQQLAEIEAMAQRALGAGAPGQGGYLGGTHLGPLDAYALTLLRWGSIVGLDPAQFPTVWAHVQKLAALPAVARVIARERLQLNLYPAAA
ncbi:MAG: glutathione S-transferase family protein [Burkholderiaceae bacterium]